MRKDIIRFQSELKYIIRMQSKLQSLNPNIIHCTFTHTHTTIYSMMGILLSFLSSKQQNGCYALATHLQGHKNEVHTLAISADGKYLASGGTSICTYLHILTRYLTIAAHKMRWY
jgi:WD40 repeat protein